MALETGNIFAGVPACTDAEQFVELLARPGVRIEKIVSTGQASPPGHWYDQAHGEWVIVLRGAAKIALEGEAAPRLLVPGDFIDIPAHCRHRVDWTHAEEPTVWLAVHYDR